MQTGGGCCKAACTIRYKRIYALSSSRAQQTAKPLAELTHIPIQTLDWCNENYVGQEFFTNNEKRIALFAHEGFGMAFLSAVLDIPYSLFCTHFGLTHSGMSVVRFSGEREVIPCLLQLSNDSHLYKEGLLPVIMGKSFLEFCIY